MALCELRKKLRIICDFDDNAMAINIRILFQHESLRAPKNYEIYKFDNGFKICSESNPALYHTSFFLKGKIKTLDEGEIYFEYSSKDYKIAKEALTLLAKRDWEISYKG